LSAPGARYHPSSLTKLVPCEEAVTRPWRHRVAIIVTPPNRRPIDCARQVTRAEIKLTRCRVGPDDIVPPAWKAAQARARRARCVAGGAA